VAAAASRGAACGGARRATAVAAAAARAAVVGVAAALLATAPAGGPATAATRGAASSSVYWDDNGVTVVSSTVAAQVAVPGGLDLDAAYETDVITGASVDAVTTASRATWNEVRHAGRLGARYTPKPGLEVGAAYLPSFEPDYWSHGFSAEAHAEWLDRRLTTGLVAGLSLDRVQRIVPIRTVWARLELGAVLDARTVATLAYEVGRAWGRLSSPYLWVELHLTGGVGADLRTLRDTVPGEKLRHALVAGVRRALAPDWFARASYRFYADDWGLRSHTGEVEVSHVVFDERVTLGATARAYGQTGVRFWRRRYDVVWPDLPQYFTTDKLLGPMWSVGAGLRSEVRFPWRAAGADLVFTSEVWAYAQTFPDYASLRARHAIVGSLGIALEL
jgi:hypothetical protein